MTRHIRGHGTPLWLRDDFDEDSFFKDSKQTRAARKTAQLCAIAERTLGWVVEAELDDPRLPDLTLSAVKPHPDASHLLVVMRAPAGTDLRLAQEVLRQAGGHLREILAQALDRRRVPMLSFLVLPEGVDHDE
jgi:ribosome-binding factor A